DSNGGILICKRKKRRRRRRRRRRSKSRRIKRPMCRCEVKAHSNKIWPRQENNERMNTVYIDQPKVPTLLAREVGSLARKIVHLLIGHPIDRNKIFIVFDYMEAGISASAGHECSIT